jgi:hypothetical protein
MGQQHRKGGNAMNNMRLLGIGLVVPLALLVILGAPASVVAWGDGHGAVEVRARLRGFQEVPVISTEARGHFRAKINKDRTEIQFVLSYEGLEGTVTQSHIHIAQPGVNGGISVWLCQTASNPAPASVAALTQTCPQSGTVTGTLTQANVIGPPGQGVAAEEFDELVEAMLAGVTYTNVHSKDAGGLPTSFNGGEIRGQNRAIEHDDD